MPPLFPRKLVTVRPQPFISLSPKVLEVNPLTRYFGFMNVVEKSTQFDPESVEAMGQAETQLP